MDSNTPRTPYAVDPRVMPAPRFAYDPNSMPALRELEQRAAAHEFVPSPRRGEGGPDLPHGEPGEGGGAGVTLLRSEPPHPNPLPFGEREREAGVFGPVGVQCLGAIGPLGQEFPPRAGASAEHVGALAGEAVLQQCDAAADAIVQAGLQAVGLGQQIRDTADAIAERLHAKAEHLRDLIADFTAVTAQMGALAAQQRALAEGFDPARKERSAETQS